jgi:hypothetical protein
MQVPVALRFYAPYGFSTRIWCGKEIYRLAKLRVLLPPSSSSHRIRERIRDAEIVNAVKPAEQVGEKRCKKEGIECEYQIYVASLRLCS